MCRSAAILLAVVVAAYLLVRVDTGAQTESVGVLLVHVIDASTGRPLASAAVYVIGGAESLDRVVLSDSAGDARVVSLPEGEYRLAVRAHGYQEITHLVEVTPNRETLVDVRLAPTLKTIGTVRALASEIKVGSRRLSENDVAAKLSLNLLDALNDLGGITVQRNAQDGTVEGLSLEGRDPSMTSVAFDGVQISNPLALHALDPDLLQGVQTDQFNDSVDLFFLNPSLATQLAATGTYGGYQYATEKASLQSTSGAISYAAVVNERHVDSSLNGATYLDTSGLDYLHTGGISGTSLYGVVNFPLGVNWTASLRAIDARSFEQPIPTFFAGPLPYGIGPGNTSALDFSHLSVRFTGTLPSGMLAVALSRLGIGDEDDYAHRIVGLIPSPLTETTTTIGTSASIDFAFADAAQTNLMFFADGDRDDTAIAQTPELPFMQGAKNAQTIKAHRNLFIVGKVPVGIDVTDVNVSGSGAGAGAALSSSATAGANSFRLKVGTVARDAETLGGGVLDDAASAYYDCAGNFIEANAPSQNGHAVRSAVVDAGWTWTHAQTTVSAYAYDESDRGVTLTDAQVPLGTEPAGAVPAGYAAELQDGYSTYGGCPGSAPATSRIYLIQDLNGLSVLYRGVNLAWNVTAFRERVNVSGFLDGTQAILAGDPRLNAPFSIYIPGRQLPNIAPWRAGLSAGWGLPDDKTELMLSGIIASRNNSNNLPGYAYWTAGIERRISPACTLEIVSRNLFNSYAGLFTSPRFAQPLLTQSGSTLLENAAPLPAPDAFIRLRFDIAHSSNP
ncbi:MAG TPA: carboxypeptidase-like regulatory domain-containing protein [Candidatus Baltobacteraceae bacterium]|nr:carboxypeptidase-like regulatory domain-containing protein [Candidatus Baltobacteraceae bacterium]